MKEKQKHEEFIRHNILKNSQKILVVKEKLQNNYSLFHSYYKLFEIIQNSFLHNL